MPPFDETVPAPDPRPKPRSAEFYNSLDPRTEPRSHAFDPTTFPGHSSASEPGCASEGPLKNLSGAQYDPRAIPRADQVERAHRAAEALRDAPTSCGTDREAGNQRSSFSQRVANERAMLQSSASATVRQLSAIEELDQLTRWISPDYLDRVFDLARRAGVL